MYKSLAIVASIALLTTCVTAQTLFTYGNKKVSTQEFLQAFNKNPTTENKQTALKEYLTLYINYKLKVEEAYAEGLQNQSSFTQEITTFKQQIADNIINENIGVKKLAEEAYERAKFDIEIAHIVVENTNAKDSNIAYMQILAAQKALQEGKAFAAVTKQFSTNELTKQTNGYLGFITVFKLPYTIETAIYNTAVGNTTGIVKSNIGYHIFNIISKRPAVGKRSIAQILLAVPPDATADELSKAKQLADSVYTLLQKGESFKSLAARFSNDAPTAYNGGIIANAIGIGDFEPVYEQAVFGLQQPGQYSKPFATAYGYHIVQLLEKLSVNEAYINTPEWQQTFSGSDRIALARNKFAPICKQLVQLQRKPYVAAQIWQYTDSSLQGKPLPPNFSVTDNTLLFSIKEEKYTVKNWLQFINSNPKKGNNYSSLMEAYENQMAYNYYSNHLEQYNTIMQQQLKEFNDANLLFAAMEKHVWTKATTDTLGLQQHFEKNKNQYKWQPSISAIVVTCNSVEQANAATAYLQKNSTQWLQLPNIVGSNVMLDSSRFQLNQLPINQTIAQPTEGLITTPEKTSSENLYTFLYITKVHPQIEQRSFAEAKGLVVNDYQQVLEENWIKALRKKYPVVVNNTAFNALLLKNK